MLILEDLKTIKHINKAEEAFKELPKYIYDSLEDIGMIGELDEYHWYHIGHVDDKSNYYNAEDGYFEFSFIVYMYNGSYAEGSDIQLRYDKNSNKWEINSYEDTYFDYTDAELWKHMFFNKRKIEGGEY